MKNLFYLMSLLFLLVSCKEDVVRTSISSGEATFVCIHGDRTLEYLDKNDNEMKEIPYGTCEEFRNQSEDSFGSFEKGTCAAGEAYLNTSCETEFKRLSLDKSFDCDIKNSTRVYGVPDDLEDAKKDDHSLR